ncbi:GDP-D-mannose dehydratase [Tenggerimyces flavus]|nr:GDP-D-mannose dehydratase [Tenggerimyces flavus]
MLITPVDPQVTNLDEWRKVAFTSDYSEMTWLMSQVPPK